MEKKPSLTYNIIDALNEPIGTDFKCFDENNKLIGTVRVIRDSDRNIRLEYIHLEREVLLPEFESNIHVFEYLLLNNKTSKYRLEKIYKTFTFAEIIQSASFNPDIFAWVEHPKLVKAMGPQALDYVFFYLGMNTQSTEELIDIINNGVWHCCSKYSSNVAINKERKGE